MKYCPTCLAEYEPSIVRCADCDEVLVAREIIEQRPEFHRYREGDDPTRYVLAGTAEDLYEADAFAAALGEAGIPFMVASRRASTVGIITTGSTHPWWELRVPEGSLELARAAVMKRRAELVAEEADAAQAAEEEAEASAGEP